MHKQFLEYINEYELITRESKVLLAVSGGIDSMVMADLFIRSGIQIGIAHCNFCLRGEESDKDEELVREYALSHKVSFYTTRFRTEEFARQNGISIQMAARDLRYDWFEIIRKDNDYDYIAVAHNLNDNIETLLINLTRGTGIAGMSGIKKTNNNIIRPLLFATRVLIEKYQKEHNIEYREDSSNPETKYVRNKIRHQVIPLLKDINPSVEITLNTTAERMSDINDIVVSYIGDLKNRLIISRDGNYTIDTKKLKPYLGNQTIIFELFRTFGVNTNNLDELYKIISGRTGARLFTSTHLIIKNRSEIIITLPSTNESDSYIIFTIEDLNKVPVIQSAGIVEKSKSFRIPADPDTACLDAEKISYPLLIRKWKPGDFFYPFGMAQRKKLSNYLIDRKFSIADKNNVQVMESDGRIVWIIGEKIDNRFRITDATAKILLVKSAVKSQRP